MATSRTTDALRRLGQGEEASAVLPLIDDPEVWSVIRYGVDPKLKHRFTMLDPTSYGSGAPAAVFQRIMDAFAGGKLTQDQAAIALGKFSRVCLEDEWRHLYRPVLARTLPFDWVDFNEHAPTPLRFPVLREYAPKLVQKPADLPQSFLMEPAYAGRPVLFFVTKNHVEARYHTGRPFEHDNITAEFEALAQSKTLSAPVVFDAIFEDQSMVYLRDVLTVEQFEGRVATQPLRARRKILENVFYGVLEQETETLELAEGYPVHAYNEALVQFNMLLEQGFDAFFARDLHAGYWDTTDALVHPRGQIDLRLSALNEGARSSRFEGAVWSLEGRAPGAKISHEIVLGLTSSQRKDVWMSQQGYAGRTFQAASCGAFEDGRLMFGKFIQWSE